MDQGGPVMVSLSDDLLYVYEWGLSRAFDPMLQRKECVE